MLRKAAGPAFMALLGALFALWLYGKGVMRPASGAWLLQGDAAQHYVGSAFFLAQGWQWPPGTITRFGQDPTSVVFSDAIPLLALAAKAWGLPPGHQYFGLWMLACHALAGAAAWLLLCRLGVRSAAALLAGSLFFVVSPMMLMRAYGHEALMGHFLVILALERALAPWRWWPWLMLAAVAVAVHPYLALMVCVIGMSAAIAALVERSVSWPRLLMQGVACGGVLLALAWLAGYVTGSAEVSAKGHGFHSANLLTWIDPMNWRQFMAAQPGGASEAGEWSAWLPPQAQATQGQYEGFAYLGAGVLAAIACAVLTSLRKKPHAGDTAIPSVRWAALWCSVALLAVLAFSARPSIGSTIGPEVELGETAAWLLGVFRASGRFVWPLSYLVMAVAFRRVAALRWGPALLALCLLLQGADLRGKLEEFRTRFRAGPPGTDAVLSHPIWTQALKRCPRLHVLSAQQPPPGWAALALAAAKAGASFEPAPTARVSKAVYEARIVETHELVALQVWRPDTVYVLAEPLTGEIPLSQVIRNLRAGVQHHRVEGYDLVLQPSCL
jgi:hypothetical protein